MRIETIDELAGVLNQSSLTSLELESDGWSLVLERMAPPCVVAPTTGPSDAAHSGPMTEPVSVEAPMVGVFHEAPLRVAPGQAVRADDSLGTIDALTIRNDIRAPMDAVVCAVQVEDGQPVEFGQVLFTLDPSGGDK